VSSLPSVKDMECMLSVQSVCMLDLLIPEHVLNSNQNVGELLYLFCSSCACVSPHKWLEGSNFQLPVQLLF